MKLIKHEKTFTGSGIKFKASTLRPHYARCKLEALKSMAARRGVKHDKFSRAKQSLIDALKAADEEPFDFLGLPAEVRDMIYTELLIDDSLVNLGFDRLPVKSEKTLRSRKDFSILDACKQLKAEGEHILAESLHLTVVFQVIARKDCITEEIWFANKKRGKGYIASFSSMLDGRSDASLDQAREAKKMIIVIVVRSEGYTGATINDWHLKLSTDFRSFISLLMDNNVIKRLHIVLDFHNLGGDEKADAIVRPLFHLYNINRVSVTARGIANTTVEQLKASIKDSTPKHNMLQHCHLLFQDAQAFSGVASDNLRRVANMLIDLSYHLQVDNRTTYFDGPRFWLDEGNDKGVVHFARIRAKMQMILVVISLPGQKAKLEALETFWRREALPGRPYQVISAMERFIENRQASEAFHKRPYFKVEADAALAAATKKEEEKEQNEQQESSSCHASC